MARTFAENWKNGGEVTRVDVIFINWVNWIGYWCFAELKSWVMRVLVNALSFQHIDLRGG